MKQARRLWHRLATVLVRTSCEDDLVVRMEEHLQSQPKDNIRSWMVPAEGCRTALQSVDHRIFFKLIFCALCAGLTMGSLTANAQNSPTFRMLEKPGPYAVGLKVVDQYDYSRSFQPLIDEMGKPYQGARARPLQTLIWYPAEESDSKPMTFADYIALEATETSFGRPKRLTGMEERHIASMNPQMLIAPMWAMRDAGLAPGKFPVIIYAPSFSSVSWENADLCEYLASYGYVVIAGPAMGFHRESTHDVAGTNEQARDISFLIGFARTLSDADMSALAVVGYSWGGIANLFAAARDNRIAALVSLDGSIRGFPGVVKAAGDIHPEQMNIPLLFFKGQHSLEDEAHLQDSFKSGGPNVLNEWIHGDLISVEMLGLIHPEFSSKAQRNELLWKNEFSHLQEADYDRQDGMIGYAWVARYTRAFLDAYLKHDTAATTFLRNTPAENGVPLHVMGVDFRSAKSAPASFSSFRVQVGREGFDRIIEIYETTRKEQPDFHLDPEAVVAWAYELLADGHFPQAVDVMKLGVLLDPASSEFTNLGEMYAKAGQKQAAIASYRQALQKDPANITAKQCLEQLQEDTNRR